jgi:hypothetical protein
MWVRISDEKREQKDISAKSKIAKWGTCSWILTSRLLPGEWLARLVATIHVCFSSHLEC